MKHRLLFLFSLKHHRLGLSTQKHRLGQYRLGGRLDRFNSSAESVEDIFYLQSTCLTGDPFDNSVVAMRTRSRGPSTM